jgi:hypothetical protein
MNKIGVLLEIGLLLSGIVTNFTFKVLCTWFISHFDFIKKKLFRQNSSSGTAGQQRAEEKYVNKHSFGTFVKTSRNLSSKNKHQETENPFSKRIEVLHYSTGVHNNNNLISFH